MLGPNGAGKSSLLRVIAGRDEEFEGKCWRPSTLRVGMLDQEPTLDEDRSVIENVMDGVGPARDALQRFEAINVLLEERAKGAAPWTAAALGEGERPLEVMDLEELLSEQAAVTERIDALNAWNLDAQACPPVCPYALTRSCAFANRATARRAPLAAFRR